MKRIILITSNIAPYRLRWCEELANTFDVTICYTKDKEKDYNDNFLKHSSNKCKIKKINTKNYNSEDPLCFNVINVIKNNRDALIVFDGYGPKTNLLGLTYAKLIGIKTYLNVDGYPTERNKNIIRDIIRKFVIGHLCNYFFCGGENVKDYLIRYGAKKDNICVHNFSSISSREIINKPLSSEQKQTVRDELGINCKGNIVLGVGRFIPLKRFEDLIKASKLCNSNFDLYLLGGNPTKEYLTLAENMKNIHFIDFVLPEEVYKYYMAANLFVLPSETDVWGLVINEAMAKGLPIISSDSPVAAYNLVKENGMIYKTYDINGLANCIDLCLDSNRNFAMSNKSIEIIKEYTIENMVKLQLPVINDYFNNNK